MKSWSSIIRRISKYIGVSRVRGGIIATIGYILSPLSWWNDAFVNIPISYAVASLIALIDRKLFTSSFILTYLVTNIVGLVMLHYGVEGVVKEKVTLTRRKILEYIVVSTVYTLAISILALNDIIGPLIPD